MCHYNPVDAGGGVGERSTAPDSQASSGIKIVPIPSRVQSYSEHPGSNAHAYHAES